MWCEPVNDGAHGGEALRKKVAQGRTGGKYRLSGAGLNQVPTEVYSLDALPGVNFWEEVPAKSIDLSHNELQVLPDEISTLAELQILNVSHNELYSLPAKLSDLTALQSLDISHNNIGCLYPGLSGLSSLRQLSTTNNSLTCLEFGPLPDLLGLSAQSNRISEITAELGSCSRLLALNLAGNRLHCFPSLEGLKRLEELDLSGNALEGAIPVAISALTTLKIVDLSRNQLRSVPGEISCLGRLLELKLGGNALTHLPPVVGGLGALLTLELCDNRLKSLPQELSRLSTLERLDLRNNELASLPPELGLMTQLKAMPVTGNPVRGVKPSLLDGPLKPLLAALRHRLPQPEGEDAESEAPVQQLSHLPQLSPQGQLSLAGTKLATVPDEVWELRPRLRHLDLSANSLVELPGSRLSHLPGLVALLLSKNQLQSWPLPEAALQLQSLDLSYNPRMPIPASGLQCCHQTLTSLELSGLPGVAAVAAPLLQSLTVLQELTLTRCGLTEIPASVMGLASLQSLVLSGNRLAQVPEAMTQLTALTRLSVSDNDITQLPPKLGLMAPELKQLEVDGNPLRSLRRPVLEKGTAAVLEYLKDRIPAAPKGRAVLCQPP